jgi:tetratricopeptide (TPR) repeat protein
VDAEAVDALRAERLANAARDALAAGEPRQAHSAVVDALALWRGEPLAGVPGPFAERSRARFTELRVTLMDQYFEAELQVGHYQKVQPRLVELVEEHPLRERPYVLLMRALYGMGRQVEALEVFHNARRLLIETHGIEPGAELVEVHERILRGDHGLAPVTGRAETRPMAPAPAVKQTVPWQPVPAQLPPDLPDFVGRGKQVAILEEALRAPGRSSPAVLAIVGMSGIGKTSLAVHLAHRVREWYPDGQLHVDLGDPDGSGEPLSSTDLLALLLVGLGIPTDQLPGARAERRGLLRSLVAGRRLLILLDNVSQLSQIRDVMPGTPECAVVITSRVRLEELPLSAQLTLEVFDDDEALDLLRRGVGAQRVSAEPADALALVTACDRLPLAIRIVASRLAARPRRSLHSMAERLADEWTRIAELRAGSFAVEAAFEVGFRQLSETQARDFVLLAAVAGVEFTLPEAAAVLGEGPAEAEMRTEALVDAAMLNEPYLGRFRSHTLLHSFALGRDRDRAAEGAGLDRLLAYLLATARHAFTLAVPGDPIADVLGQAASDVPGLPLADLREARAWATGVGDILAVVCTNVVRLDRATAIADAVDLFLAITPYADQLRPRLRLIRAVCDLAKAARRLATAAAADPGSDATGYLRASGRAELLCSMIALRRGTPEEVEAHARRAVSAATAAGDRVILHQALNDLGLVAQLRHDYVLAVSCLDEATALARELGHRSGDVNSSINAALARLRQGDAEGAIPSCESALKLAEEISDDDGISYALYALGLAHHARAEYEEAVERFTACAQRCLTAGIREAHARYRLADALLALGRVQEALTEVGAALVRCEELGAARDQAQALLVLGRCLAASGDTGEALVRFTQAQALFASLGLPEADDAAALAAVLPGG